MASDNFNRADTASLGVNWDEQESSTSACQILNQQLRLVNTNTTKGFAVYNGTFANDQYSEMIYKGLAGGSSFGFTGPAVRFSGTHASATGYLALVDDGATPDLRLYKFNAEPVDVTGGKATLAVVAVTVLVGDLVRIEVSGTTVRVLVNGSEKINVTDATIASGKPGFVSVRAVTGVGTGSALWDDWVGNNLASGLRSPLAGYGGLLGGGGLAGTRGGLAA